MMSRRLATESNVRCVGLAILRESLTETEDRSSRDVIPRRSLIRAFDEDGAIVVLWQ
ncbi:MAG: hypothetical protein WBF52_08450 [Geitlerinemataceae cyanobacterium]